MDNNTPNPHAGTIIEAEQHRSELMKLYQSFSDEYQESNAVQAFLKYIVWLDSYINFLRTEAEELEEEGFIINMHPDERPKPSALSYTEIKKLRERHTFQIYIKPDSEGICSYVLTGPSLESSEDLLGSGNSMSIEATFEQIQKTVQARIKALS